MDPYCIISYGGKTHKTKVHKNAGKTPKWGEEFEFRILMMSDELIVKVCDKDTFSDDTVGVAMIKMSALCFNKGVNDWFNIMYESRVAG